MENEDKPPPPIEPIALPTPSATPPAAPSASPVAVPSGEPSEVLPAGAATPPSAPPGPVPRWFSCAATDVGHVRKVNEDAFLDAREQSLWVVADGMGGHAKGDRASRAIVERLHDFVEAGDPHASVESIVERLSRANDFCRDVAQGQVMGSTVAVLYLHGNKGWLVWAGDSRIYRYRVGDFRQLTDDHSLVQELYRLGELTADEAENHPSSNVITRAIGVAEELDVQIREVEIAAGDRFLLCSDGLFKDVAPAEVRANLVLPSPKQALDALVDLALRRGGTDNVTGIVVQVPFG